MQHGSPRAPRAGRRRTRAERAEVTSQTLVEVATRLFARRGYARVTIGELARAAHVTSGALYHHFGDKKGLFREVAEQITARLVAAAAKAVASHTDPWERLCAGIAAVLESSATPEVKVAFLEAPVVLGLDAWRELEAGHTGPLIARALEHLVAEGALEPSRARAFGAALRGMMVEAAMAVAEAEDPQPTCAELTGVIRTMVLSLKGPPTRA